MKKVEIPDQHYEDILVKDEIWKYNSKSGSHLCKTTVRSFDLNFNTEKDEHEVASRDQNLVQIGFGHLVPNVGYIMCPSHLIGFKTSCLIYRMDKEAYYYVEWTLDYDMPKWMSVTYVPFKRFFYI